MSPRSYLLLSLLSLVLVAPRAAQAEDCSCNCYFGVDCETGNFCDWGNDLFSEDSCWWRTPKPQGSVGAGCDEDYGSWGRCDGACVPIGFAQPIVREEAPERLILAIAAWANAFDEASMAGGGRPNPATGRRLDAIGLQNQSVVYGLWRLVIEVMILGRGESYIQFPAHDLVSIWEVGVADLRDEPVVRRNGALVVAALIAEMREPGAANLVLRGVDPSALDQAMFGRICEEDPPLQCLEVRIRDMANVLRGDSTLLGEPVVAPPCGGCAADVVPNDAVDFADVLEVLSSWGATSFPPADVNQSGTVDFQDLLAVLAAWGPCA